MKADQGFIKADVQVAILRLQVKLWSFLSSFTFPCGWQCQADGQQEALGAAKRAWKAWKILGRVRVDFILRSGNKTFPKR